MKKILILLIVLSYFSVYTLFCEYRWEKVYTTNIYISKIFSHNNKLFLLQEVFLTNSTDAVFYSSNQGLNWVKQMPKFKEKDVQIFNVVFTDKTSIFTGRGSFLYVFTDSNNYTKFLLDKNITFFVDDSGINYDARITAFGKNDKYVYAALTAGYTVPPYHRHTIYRSKDNGLTWELLNVYKEQNQPYEKIFSYNNEVIAVPSSGNLRVSTDYGSNWFKTDIYCGTHYEINYYQGKIFKFGVWGTLEVTTDFGKTWNIIFDESNYPWIQDNWDFFPSYSLAVEDSVIVFSLYNEKLRKNILFASTSGGKDWFFDFILGSNIIINSLSINQGFLFMQCDSNIAYTKYIYFLYRTPLNDVINTLSTEVENATPPFKLYPNPSGDKLFINNYNEFRNCNYLIHNSAGYIVQSSCLNSAYIDVSHLPSGLYNIVFISENQTFYQKFIKN